MAWFLRKRRQLRKQPTARPLWLQILFGVLAIVLICALATAVWYFTRLERFTIDEVIIVGGETIDHELIRSRVTDILSGSYALLIPKRFVYLYPEAELAESVLRYPRLYDLQIVRDGRTLTISFSEHIPHALWCDSLSRDAGCVFLNEEGQAFLSAPPLRGGVFARHVVASRTPEVGERVVPEESWERNNEFIKLLSSELRYRVSAVTETTDEDIHFELLQGGTLIVAPTLSVEESFFNLVSVLESKEFTHIEPGNFNYIDLRFGNKVYVNEEFPEPEVEQEETASSTEEEIN